MEVVFPLILLAKNSFFARRGGLLPLMLCLLLVGFFDTLAAAQPYGLTNRAPLAPFLNGVVPPVSPVIAGNWSAVVAFPGLTFTNSVGLTFVPGTNRLCVWEREGRVWSFVNSSNATQRKLVLDISQQCQGWDDSGLLGLAFHPGFTTNHFVFVYYTWVVPGTVQGNQFTRPPTFSAGAYHDRLSRFTLDANGVAVPGSETIFVDQPGDSVWHNGGGMFFHPVNGFLYWTDGDDANFANTQIITNQLLSGVFRIDVDRRGGDISHAPPRGPVNGLTTNYFIPNDNPFVGQSNVLEEFFCLGLRNPHRMTCDPVSGRIFIGDVGLSAREEVDVIEPSESGLNFQWSAIEGLNGDLIAPYVGINRRPALDYPHTDGNFAIIGGYAYRGSRFAAELAGKFIFGDNGSDTVWAMLESSIPAGKIPLCTVPKGNGSNSGNDYTGLASFGVDAAGEIYMCAMGCQGAPIYTLSHAGAFAPAPPALFSQLGAFTNLATLAPAPWLVPYAVNSPLWSDAAVKSRWLALPTNTVINFYPNGEWTFPAGTAFFKNFELVTNENFPAQRRRLETRLLVCDTNGYVYGATYKWRADNSDADLINTSTNETIAITTATGTRSQPWTYPGRLDCLNCHNQASGGVLGLKTRQLNGNCTYASGVTDNQLRAMNHVGFFTPALVESAITNYSKLVAVTDTNSALELRARSYFDANCAHCHRPGGVAALMDMRFDTPLVNQGLINAFAISTLGTTGARIIAPGSISRSVLFQRANSLGGIQMPPLAKNVVDTNAMAVVAAWINSLSVQASTLPQPWRDTDLGDVVPGDATFASGTFSVTASGYDFWNGTDAGQFVYQPIRGDGQIIARVVSQQYTDPWAKAGVMFRETTATGSRHINLAITPGNAAAFQWRLQPDDETYNIGGPDLGVPHWLKLVRTGSVFTGSISADGTNWMQVASINNPLAPNLLVGLAVTAHNPAVFNQSIFDNVSLAFSNGQPFYANAAATADAATLTGQTFHFTAQGVGGNLVKNFDTTDDRTGIISAQGDNAAFGEVATNAFDNNTATKWLDFAPGNPATRASWIQYRYANNLTCIVTQYTITSANDAPERDPKNWRLLGSNDGGISWLTLDTRTNQIFSARFQKQSFSPASTNDCNLYRLQIDCVADTNTANSLQLSELEFIGSPVCNFLWSFGDGATSIAQNPAHTYATNGNFTVTLIATDGETFATNSFTLNAALAAPAVAQWVAGSASMVAKKFHISAAGSDGASYIIEATTNLKTWTPLITNTPTGGLLLFTDAASTNLLHRFYRIRTP